MGLILLFIAGALVIAYCAWALILYLLQATFLYQPVRDVLETPAKLGLDFESVIFKTSDGLLLTGWYVPAPLEMSHQVKSTQTQAGLLTGPADKSQLTILFCQGNGGNVMHRLGQRFESCAVCAAGKDRGAVYGCVKWGHDFEYTSDGTLFGSKYIWKRWVEGGDFAREWGTHNVTLGGGDGGPYHDQTLGMLGTEDNPNLDPGFWFAEQVGMPPSSSMLSTIAPYFRDSD